MRVTALLLPLLLMLMGVASATPSMELLKRNAVRSAEAAVHTVDSVRAGLRQKGEGLVAAIPSPCRELASDFLSGALSVVMVGQSLKPVAAGYGAEPMPSTADDEGRLEAIRTHTTSKFLYASGVTAAELLLLRVFYREPHGNRRRNRRVLCFFSSSVGFRLLTVLLAIPNGVAPLAVLVVMLWKLCDSVYTPAIIIANVVRPYIVAAIRSCPCTDKLTHKAQAAIAALMGSGAVGGSEREAQGCAGQAMATLLWITIVVSILFLSAARDDGAGLDADDATAEDSPEDTAGEAKAKAKRPQQRPTSSSSRSKTLSKRRQR